MIRKKSACLIQHANGPYVELLAGVGNRHREYCHAHGMDYRVFVDKYYGCGCSPHRPNPAGVMWERYDYMREAIADGYEHVFYLDADAVIVDRSTDLRAALPDERAWLALGYHDDWFQGGVQYVRGCDQADSFFHYMQAFWSHERNDEYALNGAINRLKPWHFETPGIESRWHSIRCKGHGENCVVRAFHNDGDAANRLRLMRDVTERLGT
jgi:hypothetical protein